LTFIALYFIVTPTDFLLWGFLQEIIYSNNPRSMVDLKHNTKQVAAGPDQQILWKFKKNHFEKGECLSSRRSCRFK